MAHQQLNTSADVVHLVQSWLYMCPPVIDKNLHLIDDTERSVRVVLVLFILPQLYLLIHERSFQVSPWRSNPSLQSVVPNSSHSLASARPLARFRAHDFVGFGIICHSHIWVKPNALFLTKFIICVDKATFRCF